MSETPQKLPLAKVAGWHVLVMVVCFLGFQIRGCHSTEVQAMERVELTFLPPSGGGAEAPPQTQPVSQPKPEQPAPQPREATVPPKPTPKPRVKKDPKPAPRKYTRAEEIRRRLESSKTVIKRTQQRTSSNTSQRPIDTRQLENALTDAVGPNTNSATSRRGGSSTAPPDYLSELSALLYQSWQQPYANRTNNGLSVGVRLVIRRNGSLSSKTITRRSRNAQMDASVEHLLRGLSRVPPLPDSVTGSSLAVNIDLVLER